MPKFSQVKVELVGQDGNAFSILGRVKKAMRLANIPQTDIDEFMNKAMSGDYNNLLNTVMEYVSVDGMDNENMDDDTYFDNMEDEYGDE